MSKLKDKIFLKQWLNLKPYTKQTPTDSYYLELCNTVKQSFINNKETFAVQIYLKNDEIDLLSCFLTSYFEDLISETNIWNSFAKAHKELYGKRLPFFDEDEYFENEINFADVRFLIWYFLNTIQKDAIIAPNNEFIAEAAKHIVEVFENEWEFAPENVALAVYYTMDEAETDYYKARSLIETILFKSYLFYPDTAIDLQKSKLQIIEENKHPEHLLSFLTDNKEGKTQGAHTKLLAFTGKEWAAQLIGENQRLSKDFREMSRKINGYFFFRGQDNENIFIEHIASGKKFNITKKSFDYSKNPMQLDSILFMGIVRWRNEWWFSGIFFQSKFSDDLVQEEKKSLSSRRAVNFLDHQEMDMEALLGDHLKLFLKFNHHQQIAFMDSDKIESFASDFMEFWNRSLQISKAEKENTDNEAKQDKDYRVASESIDITHLSESGLVFFNPKSGIEVAMGINSAFPMKNNPYFNQNESNEHLIYLLYSDDISPELVKFCIDHFKDQLPFFETEEGKLYLDNLDFLLRFWKQRNYFTKPEISFTNQED